MVCRHVGVQSRVSARIQRQSERGQGRRANCTESARKFHRHQECDGPQSVFHIASDLVGPSVVVDRSQAVAYVCNFAKGHSRPPAASLAFVLTGILLAAGCLRSVPAEYLTADRRKPLELGT